MLKTIGLNTLIALIITIPIVIWANPLPASAVSLIFIVSLSIVSIIIGLFKKKNKDNSTLLIITFIALTALLNGCSSLKGVHVAGRSYLNELQKPNCQFGAYGYILLTEPYPNDNKDYEKLKLIAEMFKSVFEPQEVYLKKGIKPSEMMIMYWLLKGNESINKDITSDQMIANYDYARAKLLLTKLGKAGKKGPVFVAWNKPCASEIMEKEALVFDITDFDNDDIKKAFYTWNERVSNDPAYWKDGFNMELFRSAFRNFLITHADCLLKMFTSGKD